MYRKQDEAPIENHLAALRRKRGLSASALAVAAGVSRQTIYAIEAGTYVPNTAVALRLARVLRAGVEELFALPADAAAPELPAGAGDRTAGRGRACSRANPYNSAAWTGAWWPRRPRRCRGISRPAMPS